VENGIRFHRVDSPPVLPVTDAQLLEEMADATVLLARVGFTTSEPPWSARTSSCLCTEKIRVGRRLGFC
jgi:hypothetical protein